MAWSFIAAALFAIFSQVNPLASQPSADLAFGAYQRGYYATAMTLALKRVEADLNDAAAMTLIAQLFHDGTGTKQDFAQAQRWYGLAADRGNREATFALAMMFLQGEGTPPDRAAAVVQFEKAAAQGHAGAMYNLGIIEVEQKERANFKRAAGLFERAAELGDPDAAYAMAALFREGRGVEVDAGKSTQWLAKAAALHHGPGRVEYAIALFNGTGIEKDENAAAKMFLKDAYGNNPVAQNRLARLLVVGRGGLNKDIVEAMKWHLLASSAGIADEWLEDQLKTLTKLEQNEVELAVRAYVGSFSSQ